MSRLLPLVGSGALAASVAVEKILARCVDAGDDVTVLVDAIFDDLGANCIELRTHSLKIYGITRLPDGRTITRVNFELLGVKWPEGVQTRQELVNGWVIERDTWQDNEVDDLDEELYDGGGLDGNRGE